MSEQVKRYAVYETEDEDLDGVEMILASDYEGLETALMNVQRGENCWCEKAVGNPMQKHHSAACIIAQAAIKRGSDD